MNISSMARSSARTRGYGSPPILLGNRRKAA
jgi:hypothetical protein